MKNILVQNKNILLLALGVALILLLPWTAMQLTRAVAWSTADFVLAGVLLFGAGLAFERVPRQAQARAYRAGFGLALATALLLMWVNLAVGLIGSEDDPANRMYIGVLAIALFGALLARFRPQGLARTMFATAIAQALPPVVALLSGALRVTSAQELGYVGVVFVGNGIFVALWAGAGWLFRRAGAG